MKNLFLGFFLFFIFISSICLADDTYIYQTSPSNKTCMDNFTAQYKWDYVNVSNSSQWLQLYKNYSCDQNCSTTLNDCRWDEFSQMSSVLGLVVLCFGICLFGLIVGKKAIMLDYPIYAILMLFFAFMGGVFDIFIERYQTIMLAMFFVPMGFFFLSLFMNLKTRQKMRSGGRASGR